MYSITVVVTAPVTNHELTDNHTMEFPSAVMRTRDLIC